MGVTSDFLSSKNGIRDVGVDNYGPFMFTRKPRCCSSKETMNNDTNTADKRAIPNTMRMVEAMLPRFWGFLSKKLDGGTDNGDEPLNEMATGTVGIGIPNSNARRPEPMKEKPINQGSGSRFEIL
ncbi:hypothetical protein M5689_020755 [Euphorbia peplus]|nr:hypothetical protein M5689_020755 [Euphorbia peplus]